MVRRHSTAGPCGGAIAAEQAMQPSRILRVGMPFVPLGWMF